MRAPDWALSLSPSSDMSMEAAPLPAGFGSCGNNKSESGCEGSGASGINTGPLEVRIVTGGAGDFHYCSSVIIRQLLSEVYKGGRRDCGEGGASFVPCLWPSSPKSGKKNSVLHALP
jgi:hypothetical protein